MIEYILVKTGDIPLEFYNKTREPMTTSNSSKQMDPNLLSIRYILPLLFLLLIGISGQAQWVLINEDGGNPASTAAFEVRDTSHGILFPRLTTNQMNSITPNTAGLIIYNTDSAAIYFNNGSAWVTISSPWTVDNDSLTVVGKNVGIGTTAASSALTVIGDQSPQVLIQPLATTGKDAEIQIVGARNGATSAKHAQLTFGNYDNDLTATNFMGSITGEVTNAVANTGDMVFYNYSDGATATETMRINSSGNVGIGTTSPEVPLQIDGGNDANLTATSGYLTIGNTNGDNLVLDNNEIMARKNGATSFLALQANGGVLSVHGGTSDVNKWAVITDDGNLWLGDTVAANDSKLRVAGKVFADTLAVKDGVQFPTNLGTSGQVLESNGSGLATWETPTTATTLYNGNGSLSGNRTVTQGANTLAFTSSQTNGFSVDGTTFSVDAANNQVGIGTSAPTAPLTVASNLASSVSLKRTVTNADTNGIAWQNTGGAYTWNMYQDATENLHFRSNTGDFTLSNLTEKLTLKNNGNVGIGTSTTDSLLTVAGGIEAEYIKLSGGAAANKVLTSDLNGSASWEDPAAATTLYSANGSLTGNRTVTAGSNTLAVTSTATNGFSVDGTTFSVDAANNRVGIGTAAPDSLLSVAGGIEAEYIKLGGGAGANKVLTSDATGSASWETPTASPWTVSGSDVYRSSGFVGIGTTSPYSALTIEGSDRGELSFEIANNSWEQGIAWQNTGGNYTWNVFRDSSSEFVIAGGSNANIYALDDYFHIKANGNIGISNDNPDSLLSIAGGIEAEYIKLSGGAGANQVLTSDANGAASWQTPTTTTSLYSGNGSLAGNRTVTQGANTLAFTSSQTDGFSVDGSTFSVDAANNRVGIGTASPTRDLQVDGDVRITGQGDLLELANGTTTYGTIGIADGNGRFSLYENAENDGDDYSNSEAANRITMTTAGIDFYTAPSGIAGNPITWTERMAIETDGDLGIDGSTFFVDATNNRVGIGTTSPSDKLEVVGGITTDGFVLSGNGAGASKVLTSNASGVATWQTVPSSTDNLGNHTATANIQLNGNWLSNDGGNEGIRIDNAGEVGIGISNPVRTLHVHDAAAANNFMQFTTSTTGVTGSDGGLIGQAGVNMYIWNYENGYTSFRTNNTERVRIDNTGNVGIGTTNPLKTLHVSGSGIFVDNNLGLGYRNAANSANLNMIQSSVTDDVIIAGTNTNNIEFLVSGANPAMYIKSGGQVGIGTTTFSTHSKLHIYEGGTANSYVHVENTTEEAGLRLTNSNADWLIHTDDNSFNNLSSGDLGFYDYTNDTYPFMIDAGGDVGIGTTDPDAKLHVSAGDILLDNARDLRFLDAGGVSRQIISLTVSDHLQIGNTNIEDLRFNTGSTSNAMVIESGGNVGIGTTSLTQAKFVVNGNVNVNNGSFGYLFSSGATGTSSGANNYSIYASGAVGGNAFHAFSDARIKNIKGISNSKEDLATLAQIEVRDYTMIDTIQDGNRSYKKAIAQQLIEVYPLAVFNKIKRFVPNIYELTTIKDGWVKVKSELKVGDRVKLIFAEEEKIFGIEAVSESGFKVKSDELEDQKVFVYGSEIDDFHTVDYESITMLNVSATQELIKRIQILENEKRQMQIEVDELKAFRAKDKKKQSLIEERLEVLEKMMVTGQVIKE